MDLEDFYKKIATNIKFYRKKLNFTQEKLAEKAGLSTDYLGKIEAEINKPGLVGLYKIVTALEIPFKDFFKNF